MDGNVHLVDVKNAKIKWSVDTERGTVATSWRKDKAPLETIDDFDEDISLMVPSLTGNLYIWTGHDEGMKRFPFSMRDLVAQCPFYTDDRTLYVSSKHTRILHVDRTTGEVVCKYDTDKPITSETPDNDSCSVFGDQLARIVRVDYAVQAVDGSGNLKWNVTYSDVHPGELTDVDSQMPTIITTSDGVLYLMDRPDDPHPKTIQFPSQPVSIYQCIGVQHKKIPLPAIMDASGSETKQGIIIRRTPQDSLYAQELRDPRSILESNTQTLPGGTSLPPRITVPEVRPPKREALVPANALMVYSRGVEGFHPMDHQADEKNDDDDDEDDELEEEKPEKRKSFISKFKERQPVPPPRENYNLIWIYGITLVCATIFATAFLFRTRRPISPTISPETMSRSSSSYSISTTPPSSSSHGNAPSPTEIIQEPVIDDGYDRVGKLKISKTKVLGRGSNGTVVYLGLLDGRTIAVKRMLREFYTFAEKEISLLIESDQHPNVVRYFTKEEDNQFVYLALEYCPNNLEQVYINFTHEEKIKSLQQLVDAVKHIHSIGIVHRDLKPINILVSAQGDVKLSDMGLGKRLEHEQSSFHTDQSAGTLGWQAPESLSLRKNHPQPPGQQERLTRAIDMFSLGCIIYHILTGGKHPFGEPFSREANIIKNKYKLDDPNISLCVRRLIESMLNPKPDKRPTASQVAIHPLFWSDEYKLSFLGDVSDQLGKEKNLSQVYHYLQSRRRYIFSRKIGGSLPQIVKDDMLSWDVNLDPAVVDNCLQYRKYDYSHVWDLLRCIRNIRSHYREYNQQVQELMKPLPSGIFGYFDRMYPNMFQEVYEVACRDWSDKPVFQQYLKM
ncbi:serine/threonine-protein kinase/endoribonuclease [Acrasis kona]|uniref:non-specific serine/threonine protein kinase n=1 Tax=Acrasis kona TaxID=1008807 RepID=A0AAW2Z8C3_9EUKA